MFFKDVHFCEFANCILNGLKGTGFIEFDLSTRVERLYQPLDLVEEGILIVDLISIFIGDEVGQGDPIGLHYRE